MQFGFAVNGYDFGDLVAYVDQVIDTEVETLMREFDES